MQVEALVANLSPSTAARSGRPSSAVPAHVPAAFEEGKIASLFDKCDLNRDGVLDRQEFRKAFLQPAGENKPAVTFKAPTATFNASPVKTNGASSFPLASYYVGADGKLI